MFWKARSLEKLAGKCRAQTVEQNSGYDGSACELGDKDFFEGMPSNETYYGYLIKLRTIPDTLPVKVDLTEPVKPEGERYRRIEALASLGLRDEAVIEVRDAIRRIKNRGEFLYLGYIAMKLQDYKEVIYYAEPKKDRELLPYSYPLGFWDRLKPAADMNNLDAHLVAALIREESRFDPQVISWAGAVGLMQLMPATARRLKHEAKVELKDRAGLHDPGKNILLGTHYLSKLMSEFEDVPLAVAAYNAGENRIRQWIVRFQDNDIFEFIENIPYRETRRYVKRVLKSYWQYRTINGLAIQGKGITCANKCGAIGRSGKNTTSVDALPSSG